MFFLSCRTDFVSILFFSCVFSLISIAFVRFVCFFYFFWSLEFVFSNSAFVINVCFSESLVIKYAFKTVRECDYKMIPFDLDCTRCKYAIWRSFSDSLSSNVDINPSAPKSDWLLVSPYTVTLESNVKVMRM